MHVSYSLHSVKSCAVAMMVLCGTCFTLCWAEILHLLPRPLHSIILGMILFVARLMKKKFDSWSCGFQCGIVANARGLPWKCCINVLQSVADLRDICMLLRHCYVSFSQSLMSVLSCCHVSQWLNMYLNRCAKPSLVVNVPCVLSPLLYTESVL